MIDFCSLIVGSSPNERHVVLGERDAQVWDDGWSVTPWCPVDLVSGVRKEPSGIGVMRDVSSAAPRLRDRLGGLGWVVRAFFLLRSGG